MGLKTLAYITLDHVLNPTVAKKGNRQHSLAVSSISPAKGRGPKFGWICSEMIDAPARPNVT